MSLRTPPGYSRLDIRAYTNGRELVLVGDPPDADLDPRSEIHHCDVMGCGWEHIIARLPLSDEDARRLAHLRQPRT